MAKDKIQHPSKDVLIQLNELHPFTGLYSIFKDRPLTIDVKSRVIIPSELRLVLKYRNNTRDGRPENILLYITTAEEFRVPYVLITDCLGGLRIDPEKTFPEEMDKEGRINLRRQVKDAGLEGKIIFYGAENHIRVYSASNWEKYRE